MFTGYQYPGSVPDVNSMSRADMPHMGSVLAKLAPGKGPMFPFAIVPHRMDVAGRSSGRAVCRITRQQIRSAPDRRQSQRR